VPPPDPSDDRRARTPAPFVSDPVLTVCYRRALAASGLDATQLPQAAFVETLMASLAHRFADSEPDDTSVRRYLDSLRLPDLALACACRHGDERAWERFVLEIRPALYRAGRAITGQDVAGRDLADSIYAELYGVGRGASASGEPRSLFRYYHGRSTLATWVRAVLAQRHVDQIREARRVVPTEQRELERALPPTAPSEPDPGHGRRVARLQVARRRTLAELPAPDRLRLGCYYIQRMTLAAVGRLVGEHEATVSRGLARNRRQIREALETSLEAEGLTSSETRALLARAVDEWPFDATAELQAAADDTF
jgi:RNA polymerase sigma factor (sigma-70 family)